MASLLRDIKRWAFELGFDDLAVTDTELNEDEVRLISWLHEDRHGQMHYMSRHGSKRARPCELVPGTIRILTVRMQYLPAQAAPMGAVLNDPSLGYVSRYALGRDYHKLMRRRLQTLAERMQGAVGPFGYRAFVDSAPVLERALARKAGLGWVGKHSNLLTRDVGSWYFLGELFTTLPLPLSAPTTEHCGSCQACIIACPTDAIIADRQVDARRCISYLTIEHPGAIPVDLRRAIGNRIYGCDDCQIVCPWNRAAPTSREADFEPRHGLDQISLVQAFAWDEQTFMSNTIGSAIRRIGYERWLRNVAVALGNAPNSPAIVDALRARSNHASDLVREHVSWALEQHANGAIQATGDTVWADP
ncbi:MAG: epoxyqueuosine reductase [Gammaproteobacteria bacterium]|jgi:epoxyqueuosine reductase